MLHYYPYSYFQDDLHKIPQYFTLIHVLIIHNFSPYKCFSILRKTTLYVFVFLLDDKKCATFDEHVHYKIYRDLRVNNQSKIFTNIKKINVFIFMLLYFDF